MYSTHQPRSLNRHQPSPNNPHNWRKTHCRQLCDTNSNELQRIQVAVKRSGAPLRFIITHAPLMCVNSSRPEQTNQGALRNTQQEHNRPLIPCTLPFRTTRSAASSVRSEAPRGSSSAGATHILCPTLRRKKRFLWLNPACDPVFRCHGWIGGDADWWRGLGFISGGGRQTVAHGCLEL